MPQFTVQTVTVAISTQVSSPFAFSGQALLGAWLGPINGAVFLQAAYATTAVSADFLRVQLPAGSGDWTSVGSRFVSLHDVAMPAPALRWEAGASQTASRAIVMIYKSPLGAAAR